MSYGEIYVQQKSAATTDGRVVTAPPAGDATANQKLPAGVPKPTASLSATDTYDPRKETTGYGPYQSNFIAGFVHSLVFPDSGPQGANDWNCKPSRNHPRPVVLLHGTWENAYNNFARIAPELKKENYCVFALNYGDQDPSIIGNLPSLRGTGPVPAGAKEIARYIDAVLAATGATQVDLIGHSQGGLQIRQYLRFEGGANPTDPSKNKVKNAISVAGSNHGTTLLGIGSLGRTINNIGLNVLGVVGAIAGQAAADQVVDSDVVKNLAKGGDTEPGVNYTVIGTKYDEVVTPYQTTFLKAGPNATVKNITLQDGCPIDLSDHLAISVSERAIGIMKNALDPQGFPGWRIPCAFNAPVTGG
jgi:triacylglycerol esterase/lipase EstA (alpha/beta hydrolase family)